VKVRPSLHSFQEVRGDLPLFFTSIPHPPMNKQEMSQVEFSDEKQPQAEFESEAGSMSAAEEAALRKAVLWKLDTR
jgi:hypothetical protein